MSRSAASGRKASRVASASQAAVGYGDGSAERGQENAQGDSAASRLSSTTRILRGGKVITTLGASAFGRLVQRSAVQRRTRCPRRARGSGLRRCHREGATRLRTRVSPMPRPPNARRSARSTCVNMSKTCVSWSGGMPIPSSRTETNTRSSRRVTESRMWPPLFVYLAALVRRFANTWVRRTTSPEIVTGSAGRSTESSCRALSMAGRLVSMAERTTNARSTGLTLHFDQPASDARDLEEVIHQSNEVPGLALHDAPAPEARPDLGVCPGRGPSGPSPAEPGDFVARAREWPGTRLCAGRRFEETPQPARAPGGDRGSGIAGHVRGGRFGPRSGAWRRARGARAESRCRGRERPRTARPSLLRDGSGRAQGYRTRAAADRGPREAPRCAPGTGPPREKGSRRDARRAPRTSAANVSQTSTAIPAEDSRLTVAVASRVVGARRRTRPSGVAASP